VFGDAARNTIIGPGFVNADVAVAQCHRYIALLQRTIGPEPVGARLRVRRADSEFDPYVDVIVEYDDQNAAARDYAIRCERDAPTRWP